MISLENISLSNILTDINISIPDGGYIGVAGPNGSGKSTLAKIIKGIQYQSDGKVSIDGFIRPPDEVSGDIGLVLSNPQNQIISSSIEEDVAFGLENMNLPSPEIASKTEEALKWASLWELRDVPAHHLSAGRQQMLVLAGITAMRPRCLIMDEATAMLDISSKTIVLEAVKKMNREFGVGIIHISHDLDELLEAQTIYILDKGRAVWEGPPSKLHHQDSLLDGIGMELPPLLRLKSLMLKDGYAIDDNAMTVEELVEEIERAILPH